MLKQCSVCKNSIARDERGAVPVRAAQEVPTTLFEAHVHKIDSVFTLSTYDLLDTFFGGLKAQQSFFLIE